MNSSDGGKYQMIESKRLKGLEAPYVESVKANKSLRRIIKQKVYIGLVILVMMVISCIMLIFGLITPKTPLFPMVVVLLTGLITITLLITSNENIKSVIRTDLEKQHRKEEANKLRIKYEKNDKLLMILCAVQIISQSINIFIQ